MFAKKFLSIVGLLFVSSELITLVRAGNIQSCTEASATTEGAGVSSSANVAPGSNYCTNDNKIHVYSAGTHNEYLPAGVYAFDSTTNVAIDIGGISDPTADKLVLYECIGTSEVTCYKTFGYIKINSQYYKVPATGTPEQITEAAFSTACGENDDGKIKDDGTLCLTGANSNPKTIGLSASGVYLSKNTATVFTNTPSDKVAVRRTDNSFTIANYFTDDYCLDSETLEMTERTVGFCASGSICDSHQKCIAGVCNNAASIKTSESKRNSGCTAGTLITDDACKGTEGYFMTKNGDIVISSEEIASIDKYYHCKGDGSACVQVENTDFKGIVPNADASNTGVPYINCANSACSGVAAMDTGTCSKAGTLVNIDAVGYSVCVTDGVSVPLSVPGIYLVGLKDDSNIFTKSVPTPENQVIIVEIKDGAATVVSGITNTYYSVNSSSKAVSTTGATTLYSCTNELNCEAITASGWYWNALIGISDDIASNGAIAEYIKCQNSQCEGVKVRTTSNVECTAEKAGLVTYNSGYELCLSTTISVSLTTEGTNNGDYMVAAAYANILKASVDNADDGTAFFFTMKVTGLNANINVTGAIKYKYVVKATLKIAENNSDATVCPGNQFDSNAAAEYKIDRKDNDETDFYYAL